MCARAGYRIAHASARTRRRCRWRRCRLNDWLAARSPPSARADKPRAAAASPVALLQAHDMLAIGGEAEMSRFDDAGMHGAYRNLVQAFAHRRQKDVRRGLLGG